MVGVPAWVWRFGPVVRALIVGPAVGVVLGLLALFSSNNLLAGLAAMVAVSLVYGIVMARRMGKVWPGAKTLSGSDRVVVVRAVRGGRDVGDARLAPGVIEYSRGLRDAADRKWWWWLIVVLGVVALGMAIVDTILGPVREAVVSWLYFLFFPIEAFWWPRRQAALVANAGRAEESATQLLVRQSETS
jgi:hypothetical protein